MAARLRGTLLGLSVRRGGVLGAAGGVVEASGVQALRRGSAPMIMQAAGTLHDTPAAQHCGARRMSTGARPFSSQPRVEPPSAPQPMPVPSRLPPPSPSPVAPPRPSHVPSLAPSSPPSVAPRESRPVSVRAFFVGQKIDLIAVVQHMFLSTRGYKISDDVLLVPLAWDDKEKGLLRSAVVVFKHGSVVLFNVHEDKQTQYLHAIMRHCGEVVPQSHRFREELECRLRPWQEKYHEMGQDLIHVQEMNEDTIKVISDVIGHSVALNFYNQKADRLLESFRILNNAVEGSGVFREMDKVQLFKLVAMNNKILTDAMASGLLEQTKPAWNFNRLDALWNDLRQEFSIADRFNKVEHKLNHVQSNTKFFLEILAHQKSNNMEYIIIVLITGECFLSVFDIYLQFFGHDTIANFLGITLPGSAAAAAAAAASVADMADAASATKP